MSRHVFLSILFAAAGCTQSTERETSATAPPRSHTAGRNVDDALASQFASDDRSDHNRRFAKCIVGRPGSPQVAAAGNAQLAIGLPNGQDGIPLGPPTRCHFKSDEKGRLVVRTDAMPAFRAGIRLPASMARALETSPTSDCEEGHAATGGPESTPGG